MEQRLEYRGVQYVVGHEHASLREWVIYPTNGPTDGAVRGHAVVESARGSFKVAVMAAQKAIDIWLDGGTPANGEAVIPTRESAETRA